MSDQIEEPEDNAEEAGVEDELEFVEPSEDDELEAAFAPIIPEADLNRVEVELRIVIGETQMPLHQMLRMARGAVVPLSAHADDDVQIFAGDVLVGRGQLKLNGENIQIVATDATLRSKEFRPPSDTFTKQSDMVENAAQVAL